MIFLLIMSILLTLIKSKEVDSKSFENKNNANVGRKTLKMTVHESRDILHSYSRSNTLISPHVLFSTFLHSFSIRIIIISVNLNY